MGTLPENRGTGKGIALGQKYFAAGLRFAVGIVVFTLGGFWLDRRLGSIPLFTIVGAIGGTALSFISVYRQLTVDRDVDHDGPSS